MVARALAAVMVVGAVCNHGAVAFQHNSPCRWRVPAGRPLRSSVSGEGQAEAGIFFYPGVREPVVPDVKLTRSRDGGSGVAYFSFDKPTLFDKPSDAAPLEPITAMRMIDVEGEISTAQISARFVNGAPVVLDAQYVMAGPDSWDRFMRFMERYSDANGLSFSAAGPSFEDDGSG